MIKRNVPFSPPDITKEEIREVCDALRSGWITTGPKTKQLEQNLADYCGTKKVVCLNSATAALELNLRVMGIGPGDEVIVPAYTYTASVSPVLHVGATPVMIDSQPDSPEMDYELVEQAITEKTKAIICVDIAGVLCDYDRVYSIVEAKKHLFCANSPMQKSLGRIVVMADAAHSLGAKRDGKMSGTFGDFTSFSFHAVKNLTTAEGGASTWRELDGVDNEELYHLYQLYSLHGQSKDALSKTKAGAWEYDIVGAYYKCNMTDIAAAVGLKQLERYQQMLARRFAIIAKYDALCDQLSVEHLSHQEEDACSSGHLYMTRVKGITEEQRNQIIVEMGERGVSCNVHYKPLPMMTAYKELGLDIKNFPNAYHLYQNEITLPLHTCLTDEDVDYVMDCYREVVSKYC